MNLDHASDQKLVATKTYGWKVESERLIRGEEILLTWSPEALLALMIEENTKMISEAGGLNRFQALSKEEQDTRLKSLYSQVCTRDGKADFDGLTESEKRAINLFIWAGCCMHKDLNVVKGGNTNMVAWWLKQGLAAPVKLMNKDNVASASAGSSAAQQRAETISEGGAVKLASLAVAIFNHKDGKKGQGDIFRIFFERELGYMIHFPDTSNTRYQCYCEAAAALLVNHGLYIKFLDQIRDKKEKRRLNKTCTAVCKTCQLSPNSRS
jgi:hypothetical protein